MSLHIVLGGGVIGQAVINDLKNRKIKVKAVDLKDVEDVETIKINILDLSALKEALKEAKYVYLCVGLPYKTTVWEEIWPKIMANVIEACRFTGAKLIFFDNVYSYGPPPLPVPFSEDCTQQPVSRKGKVRKNISDQLLKLVKEGKLEALIARSADFYGPKALNSILYQSFLERMLKGNNPQSLGLPNVVHTYAYTEDNGRALVTLALDDSCFGQVWHLPADEPITTNNIVKIFNQHLDSDFEVQYVSKMMRKILAFFVPVIKEVEDTLYQFESDYVIDFNKFKTKFPDFKVTSYEDGVKNMILSLKDLK